MRMPEMFAIAPSESERDADRELEANDRAVDEERVRLRAVDERGRERDRERRAERVLEPDRRAQLEGRERTGHLLRLPIQKRRVRGQAVDDEQAETELGHQR